MVCYIRRSDGPGRCDREAALAAAGGESGTRAARQKTEQVKGLEQAIAGHAGKWEWALCVRLCCREVARA